MPSPEFYKALLNHITDGVYFVDRRRSITYWNSGAEALTGYGQDEVIGRRCWHNILRHVDDQGRQLCRGWCPLVATMMDGAEREADVYLHHKQGHRVPIHVRTMAMRDDAGAIVGGIETFSPRAGHAPQEGEPQRQEALLDPITKIGNRRYIEQQLRARLDELGRYGQGFGALLLDINGLQQINDTHGRAIGDQVLHMVANTLASCIRAGDHVGRWGGDEFLVVLPYAEQAAIEGLARRLCFLVRQSFLLLDRRIIKVTVSAGVALAERADTVDALLRRLEQQVRHGQAAPEDDLVDPCAACGLLPEDQTEQRAP